MHSRRSYNGLAELYNILISDHLFYFSVFEKQNKISSIREESACPRTFESLVQPQSVLSRQNASRHSVPDHLPGSVLGDRLLYDQPTDEHRTFRHAPLHHHLHVSRSARDRITRRSRFQHPSGRLCGTCMRHSVLALLRILCQPQRHSALHVVDRRH